MMLPTTKSPWFWAGAAVGIVTIAVLAVWLQTWLLGLILSWFGVKLAFWQCLLIVLFLSSIFGSSRRSN